MRAFVAVVVLIACVASGFVAAGSVQPVDGASAVARTDDADASNGFGGDASSLLPGQAAYRLGIGKLYGAAAQHQRADDAATADAVTDAIRLLHESADEGYPAAQARLGTLYAFGVGVQRSEARAVLFYTFAAMNGDAEANAILAHRYQHGIGVARSCTKAAKYAKAAADNVARSYSTQIQPNYDTTKLDFGGKSHAAKRRQSNEADHTAVLELQADKENAQACMMLGYGYTFGRNGLKPDAHRAIEYFTKAVRLGESSAYGALGDIYSHGVPTADPPIPRDLKLAHRLYSKGAEKDHPVSHNGLGFLFAAGLVDENGDVTETVSAAAVADDDDGVRRLPSSQAPSSMALEKVKTNAANNGGRPAPNWALAMQHFKAAADKGSAEGSYNLAVLHLNGRGTKRDVSVARTLFEGARKAGSVLARYQLANMDLLGIGRNVGGGGDMAGSCSAAIRNFNEVNERGTWRSRQDKAIAHVHSGEDGAALLDYLVLAEQGVPHALHNAPLLLSRDVDSASSTMPFLDANTGTRNGGGSAVPTSGARPSSTDMVQASDADEVTASQEKAVQEDAEDVPEPAVTSMESDARAVVTHALLWRAVHLGQRDAHVRLGDNYFYGRGTRRSSKRAEEHYLLAAQAGSAEGHFNTGLAYAEGTGTVQRDYHLAKRHFDAAAASDSHAYPAVWLALVRMNFQWWSAHFFAPGLASSSPSATRSGSSAVTEDGMPHDDLEPAAPFPNTEVLEAEDPAGALGTLARTGRAVDAWVPSVFGVAVDTVLLGGSFLLGLMLLHMRHHAV